MNNHWIKLLLKLIWFLSFVIGMALLYKFFDESPYFLFLIIILGWWFSEKNADELKLLRTKIYQLEDETRNSNTLLKNQAKKLENLEKLLTFSRKDIDKIDQKLFDTTKEIYDRLYPKD